MSRYTARFLTLLSVVLLIVSIVVIARFGVPVVFADVSPRQIVVQASTPITAATQTSAATAEPTLPPTTVPPTPPADPDVAAIVGLINDQRKTVASAVLVYDARLSSAAQQASAVLAQGQQPSQAQIDGFVRQAGYYYKSLWSISVSVKNTAPQGVFDAWWRDVQIRQSLQSADYSAIGLASVQEPTGTRHFTILLATPITLTAPGADPSNPGEPTQEGQARAGLALLNAARSAAGLKPLALNDKLTSAAVAHSDDQAKMDKMTHDGSDGSQPADRATKAGYNWRAVGENVLERWDIHAAGAFDQWWNSPPHHENMMNPAFTEIGFAYARSGTGKYFYTLVLGTPQ